jgi:4-hydroxy-tetrahydrodipicolinate synthase
MTNLSGLWAASITPVNSDLLPDENRMASHVKWLFENGCHGVVVFGTTGEANSFSVSERRQLLDGLAKRGTDMSRIIVGAGCCAITDSIELSRHAVDTGCLATLILPPFYYKNVSEDGLFRSVSAVVEGSDRDDMRMILYHFPKMAGMGYSVLVIQRLREAHGPVIAGIKDSSGDTDNLTNYCREIDDFAVFAGSEALLPYALGEGGVGCISATANLTSRLMRLVYDGEKSLADRMIKTRRALEALPFVPMLKHVLADHYEEDGWKTVRPPLTGLTPMLQERLQEILDTTGVLPNFAD